MNICFNLCCIAYCIARVSTCIILLLFKIQYLTNANYLNMSKSLFCFHFPRWLGYYLITLSISTNKIQFSNKTRPPYKVQKYSYIPVWISGLVISRCNDFQPLRTRPLPVGRRRYNGGLKVHTNGKFVTRRYGAASGTKGNIWFNRRGFRLKGKHFRVWYSINCDQSGGKFKLDDIIIWSLMFLCSTRVVISTCKFIVFLMLLRLTESVI